MFRIKMSTFTTRVKGFLRAVHPYLVHKYINDHATTSTMLQLATSGNQFKLYKEALYATDVVFQRADAPVEFWRAQNVIQR
jgi:hypothetical protein